MNEKQDQGAHFGKVKFFLEDRVENSVFDQLRAEDSAGRKQFRLAGVRPYVPHKGWELAQLAAFITDDGEVIDLLPLTDEDFVFIIDETLDHIEVDAMMEDNGLSICCGMARIRGPRVKLEEIRNFVQNELSETPIEGTTFGCVRFEKS